MHAQNENNWPNSVTNANNTQHLCAHIEDVDVEDSAPAYHTYFGLGHSVRLFDRPDVFKVSRAGVALGEYLVKSCNEIPNGGTFLDMGTGSGVQAILLRSIGAKNIVASDVSESAVSLGAENELLNFPDRRIQFVTSDLFSAIPKYGDGFDTIVFNPPGWRTPSSGFLAYLQSMESPMELSSMFYGDQTMLRFLRELPEHLRWPHGRAIVGMNSLVGIRDILRQYAEMYGNEPPLRFRLLERHTFPLLFYCDQWQRSAGRLVEEFRLWRKHNGSAFSIDGEGNLYWSYEIVECHHTEHFNG